MKLISKLWGGIAFFIILSPLGLLVPEISKAGSAWGEWSKEEIKELVGYIPLGLEKLSAIWNAPILDYNFKFWQPKGLLFSTFAYLISALLGVLITVLICFLIAKSLVKKNK